MEEEEEAALANLLVTAHVPHARAWTKTRHKEAGCSGRRRSECAPWPLKLKNRNLFGAVLLRIACAMSDMCGA